MERAARRRASVKGLVVDASVALAWCFDDEASPASDAILDMVKDDGAIGIMQILPGTWQWIQDSLNPGPALDFAKLLSAKTLLLTSDCGHLAPGCEAGKVYPAVAAFLDGK